MRNCVGEGCIRGTTSCLLAPQAIEGPFYWNSTIRQNLTFADSSNDLFDVSYRYLFWFSDGKDGLPLHLKIHLLDPRTCLPLSNAIVDIWHCDARGIYSHYIAASLGKSNAKTDNSTFFRGELLSFFLLLL